jgi:hypothetical protein
MSILDELAGNLSASEKDGQPRSGERHQARLHYEAMLSVAWHARDELRTALLQHAPPATTFRHANAFAWANRELWRAAQKVIAIERLPYDGANDGIQHEVSL